MSLGTATPGGGFPVYGAAVVDGSTRSDPDARRCEPNNTKGSTENVPLLEAGTLDIALVQGEVVYEALSGIGRPPADLRILTAMYSTRRHVRGARRQPYRAIADLKGKPIAFGAQRARASIVLARYVMDGLGLDRDRDFQAGLPRDARATAPRWCSTARVAALWGGGAAGPASPRWRRAAPARASSRPIATTSSASSPSTRSSSR